MLSISHTALFSARFYSLTLELSADNTRPLDVTGAP